MRGKQKHVKNRIGGMRCRTKVVRVVKEKTIYRGLPDFAKQEVLSSGRLLLIVAAVGASSVPDIWHKHGIGAGSWTLMICVFVCYGLWRQIRTMLNMSLPPM